MTEYLEIFIDEDYPTFIDKYLQTKTLTRLKDVTQFCGCDYTKLYNPKFLYTRFDHSLVVAHMTWHFTHDVVETIAALLHDAGTPCFAHTIDYVFGDYLNQESSEKNLLEIISEDKLLLNYLEEDKISLNVIQNFDSFPILENKSPQLCTDRLDGVFHTCYIWLNTMSLKNIKEVYDDLTVLTTEQGKKEIGFQTQTFAEQFSEMVMIYATELQGNKDKYVMKYISEVVKLAIQNKLISIHDLYRKKEQDIIEIIKSHFSSWQIFEKATTIYGSESCPNAFSISFDTKKRNVIPLIKINNTSKRVNEVSAVAKKNYQKIENYKDLPYGYIKELEKITCE